MNLSYLVLFLILTNVELLQIKSDEEEIFKKCTQREFSLSRAKVIKNELNIEKPCDCFIHQNVCLGDLERPKENRDIWNPACGIGFTKDKNKRSKSFSQEDPGEVISNNQIQNINCIEIIDNLCLGDEEEEDLYENRTMFSATRCSDGYSLDNHKVCRKVINII
ncbi:hypothetical protein PVAND_013929 [Polypedilum vanderplanki]|uniref:Uncharacterized protein n=1 Tax=Polypedilum vanderplanki TaxID=319348 RepID=A0A9J6CSZ9_POLVA|nr:hypothetical protein PVAND_013929 [Polypedilum vanderplanki]